MLTEKYRDQFEEHTRLSEYFEPDDFILMSDPQGYSAFFKIAYAQVLGLNSILFADEFNAIAAKGPRIAGAVPAVPTPSGAFVEMQFLSPDRDNRIIQVRPTLFALYRPIGALINLAGQLVPPQPEFADVLVQWANPLSSVRGGTDKAADIRLNLNGGTNGIPQQVGGAFGGMINGLDIYTRDDPNEDYDIFVIHGVAPGYRILNNSFNLPIGGGATDNVGLDFDWYIGLQGYEYVIEPVTNEEYKKLKNYDYKFKTIPVGGVPQTSLIRGGGR